MSSYAPGTDLWLERSRLAGMVLSAVSYGIFFLLTIQATSALTQTPYRGGQIAHDRWMLLSYIWITFTLATLGFAGNARYTEMIWIDLRNASGGPTALILNELDFWVNRMALACYYLMEWFMQALLLYRCFILWDWQKKIIIPMSALFVAMVAMAIVVLGEANGAIFYNINFELVYLCLQVGLTIIYTLLVAGRLFALWWKMRDTLGSEHIRPYETAVLMIVESAALFSVLEVVFIFSFAFHSNVSNLVFLSVSHVQGIAQLLIIIRVARGRAFEQISQTFLPHTSVEFSGSLGQVTSTQENKSMDPSSTDRQVQPLGSWSGGKPLISSSSDQS